MTGGRSPRNPLRRKAPSILSRGWEVAKSQIITEKSLPENEERLFIIMLVISYLLPTGN